MVRAMTRPFSIVQNHILSKLKNAKRLRYSDLQPARTSNDLFNYHLQTLVKRGFVERSEEGYALSSRGIWHVADPLNGSGTSTATHLFKINAITILSRIREGHIEILNQVRTSHPSYGKIGGLGGVVRKGEPLEEAATRKLFEETGLRAQFKLVGMERRFLYKNDELFTDMLFPICYANAYEGELQQESEFGTNIWVGIDQAITNDSGSYDSITAIPKVLNAVKDGSIRSLPFFYQENTQRS